MIAVGVGKYDLQELRLIATDKNKHVFTVQTFSDLVKLVKSLRRQACMGK